MRHEVLSSLYIPYSDEMRYPLFLLATCIQSINMNPDVTFWITYYPTGKAIVCFHCHAVVTCKSLDVHFRCIHKLHHTFRKTITSLVLLPRNPTSYLYRAAAILSLNFLLHLVTVAIATSSSAPMRISYVFIAARLMDTTTSPMDNIILL
jgi:hypothetical protein